jgi:hypothetical protein
MFRPIIKRLCHHRSNNIVYLPKPCNPLVECESKFITPYVEKEKEKSHVPVEETKVFIENHSLIHSQTKYLPIQIQYFDNNKICKVTIHLSD